MAKPFTNPTFTEIQTWANYAISLKESYTAGVSDIGYRAPTAAERAQGLSNDYNSPKSDDFNLIFNHITNAHNGNKQKIDVAIDIANRALNRAIAEGGTIVSVEGVSLPDVNFNSSNDILINKNFIGNYTFLAINKRIPSFNDKPSGGWEQNSVIRSVGNNIINAINNNSNLNPDTSLYTNFQGALALPNNIQYFVNGNGNTQSSILYRNGGTFSPTVKSLTGIWCYSIIRYSNTRLIIGSQNSLYYLNINSDGSLNTSNNITLLFTHNLTTRADQQLAQSGNIIYSAKSYYGLVKYIIDDASPISSTAELLLPLSNFTGLNELAGCALLPNNQLLVCGAGSLGNLLFIVNVSNMVVKAITTPIYIVSMGEIIVVGNQVIISCTTNNGTEMIGTDFSCSKFIRLGVAKSSLDYVLTYDNQTNILYSCGGNFISTATLQFADNLWQSTKNSNNEMPSYNSGNWTINGFIGDGAIDNRALGDWSVNNQKIQDYSINNQKIQDYSINNQKIQDYSINNQKIQDYSINNQKIQDYSINNQKIQDYSIGLEKLSGQSAVSGQFIGYNGTKWTPTNVTSGGSGYSAEDNFFYNPLGLVDHPNNTTLAITANRSAGNGSIFYAADMVDCFAPTTGIATFTKITNTDGSRYFTIPAQAVATTTDRGGLLLMAYKEHFQGKIKGTAAVSMRLRIAVDNSANVDTIQLYQWSLADNSLPTVGTRNLTSSATPSNLTLTKIAGFVYADFSYTAGNYCEFAIYSGNGVALQVQGSELSLTSWGRTTEQIYGKDYASELDRCLRYMEFFPNNIEIERPADNAELGMCIIYKSVKRVLPVFRGILANSGGLQFNVWGITTINGFDAQFFDGLNLLINANR